MTRAARDHEMRMDNIDAVVAPLLLAIHSADSSEHPPVERLLFPLSVEDRTVARSRRPAV